MTKVHYRRKKNGQLNGSYRSAVSPPVSPTSASSSVPSSALSDDFFTDPATYDMYLRLMPPPPALASDRIPSVLVPLVSRLKEDCDSVMIEDESSLNGQSPAINGFIALKYLSDPARARNNCYPASAAVTLLLRQYGLPDGWKAENVTLWFAQTSGGKKGAAHWATVLTDTRTGEEIIVDLTASQFHPATQTPLIAFRSTWRTWLSSIVRNRHGAELQWERTES